MNLNASWESILGSPLDLSFFMTNATNEKRILGALHLAGDDRRRRRPPQHAAHVGLPPALQLRRGVSERAFGGGLGEIGVRPNDPSLEGEVAFA